MANQSVPPRTPWLETFPSVVAHAEYRLMKGHSAYDLAKKGKSNQAALSLVYDLINDDAIELIRSQFNDGQTRIVAVHAQEASGRNKIPMAYAEVLARILDLSTDPGIVQSSIANHGGAPSIYHRMMSQLNSP